MAEDAWNTRNPARVALAYTPDCRWRNRAEFLQGRPEIEAFLRRKWNRELGYRLIKQLWAFRDNRIAVRFAYEWHDDSGQWFGSYGNENWEFDEDGLMWQRIASINDLPINDGERKYHWPLGRRRPLQPIRKDLVIRFRRQRLAREAIMAAKEISVKKYVVRLSGEERERLETLLRKGKSPARRVLKARILLKADVSEAGKGWSDNRIIEALETSPSMVYRVRKQLVEEGFEAVLSRKPRAMPAVARIFDGEKEAKLIALACSKP